MGEGVIKIGGATGRVIEGGRAIKRGGAMGGVIGGRRNCKRRIYNRTCCVMSQ